MQASRLLLPFKYKALGLARTRAFAVLSQGPWLFLGVVLGVAVLFKLGIGWMQKAPEAEAFPVETARIETAPIPKVAASSLRFQADPAAEPLPATAPPLPRAKKTRRPSIRP